MAKTAVRQDEPEQRQSIRCDACGKIDDHSRHHIAHADRTHTSMHFDCCAAQGCEVCSAALETTNNAHGHDLLDAILDGTIDHLSTPSEV